jgi:hypothetical protein
VRRALSKVLLHQRDDLEKILASRYGSWLPDDDPGCEDLELLLHRHKSDLAFMERRKVAAHFWQANSPLRLVTNHKRVRRPRAIQRPEWT